MLAPKASHPYWPDAVDKASGAASDLKPWSWALERLENSHNYWIATSRLDGRPHLMLVWAIWWQDTFWFSTGPRTRKPKNLANNPRSAVGPQKPAKPVTLQPSLQQSTHP